LPIFYFFHSINLIFLQFFFSPFYFSLNHILTGSRQPPAQTGGCNGIGS